MIQNIREAPIPVRRSHAVPAAWQTKVSPQKMKGFPGIVPASRDAIVISDPLSDRSIELNHEIRDEGSIAAGDYRPSY